MPRFSVLQADKVRPVDDGSGTGSCANSFSYITEKLQVPTAAHGQFNRTTYCHQVAEKGLVTGMVVVGWLGWGSTTLHCTHHMPHVGSRDTSVSSL